MSGELHADPERVGARHGDTGIYVRGKSDDGWVNLDIAELTRESLFHWLRRRGEANLWAENTVLALLGHEQYQRNQLPPGAA